MGMDSKAQIMGRVVLAYGAGFAVVMAGLISLIVGLPAEALGERSALIGNLALFGIIALFLLAGWRKNVALYDEFITGAKQGFDLAVGLIPFLVAMLVAVSMLRASGVLTVFLDVIAKGISLLGLNTDFVPALTTALIKPFSGVRGR